MRGVSTWAIAVRKPSAEQLAERKRKAEKDGVEVEAPDPTEAALGEIEVQSFPLVSWTKRHRALRLPLVRGVVALAESLKIGFGALGISANAQLDAGGGRGDRRRRLAGHRDRLGPARDRPVLRRPGRHHQHLQELAAERARLRARREGHPHLDLPRLPVADLADEGPAARLRVPRRRAQDDLLLRGRARPDAGERPGLLAAAPALRHQLPADRHVRGDRRVRAAGHARLVHPDPVARGRHPDRRRPLVRGPEDVRHGTATSAGRRS